MAVRVCSCTVCGKPCRKLVLIVAWGKIPGGQGRDGGGGGVTLLHPLHFLYPPLKV